MTGRWGRRTITTPERINAVPMAVSAAPEKGTGTKAEGPQVGAVAAANVVQSQDDVDDLLSSLGF